jgi:TadE-like protein
MPRPPTPDRRDARTRTCAPVRSWPAHVLAARARSWPAHVLAARARSWPAHVLAARARSRPARVLAVRARSWPARVHAARARSRPARSLAARARSWPARVLVARREDGQAAVEFVALLPCAVALLIALWQFALAGHAAWAASTAARAAARAHAVGHDPRRAARDHLPASLEPGLRLETTATGEVEVAVRIPSVPGLPDLGHARATAHFAPQS